jgi:RNA polymerase sigma factor (sigma-70 family)
VLLSVSLGFLRRLGAFAPDYYYSTAIVPKTFAAACGLRGFIYSIELRGHFNGECVMRGPKDANWRTPVANPKTVECRMDAIVAMYKGFVAYLCRKRLRRCGDIDDHVQETFLRAIRCLRSKRWENATDAALKSLFVRSVRSAVIDSVRKEGGRSENPRPRTVDLTSLEGESPTGGERRSPENLFWVVDDDGGEKDWLDVLQQRGTPRVARTIKLLWAGYTKEETAAILKVSVNTVYRDVQAVKKMIDEEKAESR